MPELKSIEQERAAQALRDTQALSNESRAKKYFQGAANFGPMVVSNGLAGAMAFAKEKFKDDAQSFVEHVETWVTSRPAFGHILKDKKPRGLLDMVGAKECTAADYRWMTQEALLYANWLKRLAGAKKGK